MSKSEVEKSIDTCLFGAFEDIGIIFSRLTLHVLGHTNAVKQGKS